MENGKWCPCEMRHIENYSMNQAVWFGKKTLRP